MYRIVLPLVLSGFVVVTPAVAEDESLYDFGKAICTRAMAGELSELTVYAELVPSFALPDGEYCDCVGKAFVENSAEQAKLISEAKPGSLGPTRQKILWENFEQCLPDVYVEPPPPPAQETSEAEGE